MHRRALLTAALLAGVLLAVVFAIVYLANPGPSPDPAQALLPTARSTATITAPLVTVTDRTPEEEPTTVATPAPARTNPTPDARPIVVQGSTDFFRIAVREIQYAQAFASHRTEQTFCIVPLTATNISAQDRILVLSDFYLLDTENHRYMAVHSEGMARRIPPDDSESGTLVFEMPRDAHPGELVLGDSAHAAQVLLRLRLAP